MSGKTVLSEFEITLEGKDFIESICYLYIHKGFKKIKWTISSTDRNKPFQSIVSVYSSDINKGL